MGPIDPEMMPSELSQQGPTDSFAVDQQPLQREPTQPTTQEPYAPVAELRLSDVAELAQLPAKEKRKLPAAKNYAAEEEVRLLATDVYNIVKRIKQNRSALEDEWLSNQRLCTMHHDGNQSYKGRSNVYVPTYATARDTIVSQLARGLFPSDEYMDVESVDINAEPAALTVKDRIKYEFECNAKLKVNIKPAITQYVDHGNGVVKYTYDTGKQFIGRKIKGFQFAKSKPRGFTVSARSIFNIVVYPENASDEKEVQITAEYLILSRQYAQEMAKADRWENSEDALNSSLIANDDDQFARDTTLQDIAKVPGLGTQVDNLAPEKSVAQLLSGVEIWCSIQLPDDAYVDGESVGSPVPVRILMVNAVPVIVTRNPFFHQSHPYLWARANVVPGSFYGSWVGRKSKGLQYLINDLANQTNDCGIYALNPIQVIDTNLMSGPVLPLAPGRIYRTRNIKEAMRFEHPPGELIQYGHQMTGMWISALMDNSGAPPVLQGQGRSQETATGQSILQRNALQPLQDKVEELEQQWMVPLMVNCWALLVQYSEEPVIINGQQLTLPDLDLFDYNFKYLASSQIANQQVRAQQAIQFLQASVPIARLLAANQKQMDPTIVLKSLFRDLGLRQFEQFVFPMSQMQVLQNAAGQSGSTQGPTQEQSQEVRGSEQNAPGPAQAGTMTEEPQATDDFSTTRTIADEIAAMAGRSGGAV